MTSTDTSARFTERELSIHPSEKLLNSSVVPFLLGSSGVGSKRPKRRAIFGSVGDARAKKKKRHSRKRTRNAFGLVSMNARRVSPGVILVSRAFRYVQTSSKKTSPSRLRAPKSDAQTRSSAPLRVFFSRRTARSRNIHSRRRRAANASPLLFPSLSSPLAAFFVSRNTRASRSHELLPVKQFTSCRRSR